MAAATSSGHEAGPLPCRSGNSGSKPFCDGTHAKAGSKSKASAAG